MGPNPAESLGDTTNHSVVPAWRLKMALPDDQVTSGHSPQSCMDSPTSSEPETGTSKHLSFSRTREGWWEEEKKDERDILNLFGRLVSQLPPPLPLHLLPPPTGSLLQPQGMPTSWIMLLQGSCSAKYGLSQARGYLVVLKDLLKCQVPSENVPNFLGRLVIPPSVCP